MTDVLPESLIPMKLRDVPSRKKRVSEMEKNLTHEPPPTTNEPPPPTTSEPPPVTSESPRAAEVSNESVESKFTGTDDEDMVVPLTDLEFTKTLRELKQLCTGKGLSTNGKKSDLVRRLAEH